MISKFDIYNELSQKIHDAKDNTLRNRICLQAKDDMVYLREDLDAAVDKCRLRCKDEMKFSAKQVASELQQLAIMSEHEPVTLFRLKLNKLISKYSNL